MNGRKVVIPLDPPSGFGAAAFEQGGVMRHLARGELPPRSEVRDDFAHASGALCWDLELAPGEAREVELAVPFGDAAPGALRCRGAGRSARAAPLEAVDARVAASGSARVAIRLGAGSRVRATRCAPRPRTSS